MTLTQTGTEELFEHLRRLTPTYEYELPALGPDYAGRPLGALMDLDAIINPEKITDKNKKTVCMLARTLGLMDDASVDSIVLDKAKSHAQIADTLEENLAQLGEITVNTDFKTLCAGVI